MSQGNRGDEGICGVPCNGKPRMEKKKGRNLSLPFGEKEATRGFEPLMRVLQTLALPLGHVARIKADGKWLF
jgi:hypothetical protein